MSDCACSKHPLTNAGFYSSSHCIKQAISVHKTKQLINWRLKINMQGAGIQTVVLKYICLMPRLICKFISSVILTKSCWCVFKMVNCHKTNNIYSTVKQSELFSNIQKQNRKIGVQKHLNAAVLSTVRSNSDPFTAKGFWLPCSRFLKLRTVSMWLFRDLGKLV